MITKHPRITEYPFSLAALLVAISAIVLLGIWRYQIVGRVKQNLSVITSQDVDCCKSLDALVLRLSVFLRNGNYKEASHCIALCDPKMLAESMQIPCKKYIVSFEDSIIVPGIDWEESSDAINSRSYLHIPGDSDRLPKGSPEDVYAWKEALYAFASAYNTRLCVLNTASRKEVKN